MKRGDLVKHPKGIENVCKRTYAMGIVLNTYTPTQPAGRNQTQVKVMWWGKQSHLLYNADQLEVVSENR